MHVNYAHNRVEAR